MKKNKVSVVIPNLNGEKFLIDCLNSIKNNGISNRNVIVVDNGSTDKSLSIIRKNFPGTVIVTNKKNLGFAKGINIGTKKALKNKPDFILILNNDIIFKKNFLLPLIKALLNNHNNGISGPKIYFNSHQKKIWYAGGMVDKKRYTTIHEGYLKIDRGQYNKNKNVDYISGCAMLIKREVFEEIGLFDERFFIYYEDADFCFRAKKAGFGVVFIPKSVMFHKATIKKTESPFMNYLLARNHLLFVEKKAPLSVKLREIIRLPKSIYEHQQNDNKFAILGIRDYFLRRFGYRDYWS